MWTGGQGSAAAQDAAALPCFGLLPHGLSEAGAGEVARKRTPARICAIVSVAVLAPVQGLSVMNENLTDARQSVIPRAMYNPSVRKGPSLVTHRPTTNQHPATGIALDLREPSAAALVSGWRRS